MSYYVYYNKPKLHSRVHHESCRYYRNRKENKAHSRWSQGYADLGEADKAALVQDSVSYIYVARCKVCLDGTALS